MTNNDMGPAFGFILIGMLALLILTSIARDPDNILIARALKILDDSFYESIVHNEDISDSYQNPIVNDQIFNSEDLSW